MRFVNDSKATNVDAAARSIESFSSVVAIVGGKFKGGDLHELAGPLTAHGRAVVAIGEARPLIREALAGTVPVVEADSLAEAVRRAWTLARARRRGAARAGVRELRHVRGLRGPRTAVQGGGATVRRGGRVTGEQ